MGIQLNFGDHLSRVPFLISFPSEWREDAKWARARAIQISNRIPGANVYFKSLPKGRSLSALLADRAIWVNYMHSYGSDGACVGDSGYKEIGIHYWVFRRGRVHVLGTLIHELAHMTGAGDSPSKAAEEALVHCGLGTMQELRSGINDPNTPYDPRLSG